MGELFKYNLNSQRGKSRIHQYWNEHNEISSTQIFWRIHRKEVRRDQPSLRPIETTCTTASITNVSVSYKKNIFEKLNSEFFFKYFLFILNNSGRAKNNTEITRFYGPATSCNELEMLGYTLNGLYFVDCKDKSNKGKIEVIECRFKQPHGSKQGKLTK